MFRPSKFWKSETGPFTRCVGVEIEFLNSHSRMFQRLDPVLIEWNAQRGHDSSIRTTGYGEISGSGCEVRTAPASGALFIQQITEICGVINEFGGKVNDSCGLHVHVDARDFKTKELPKVAKIWDSYEKQFLKRIAKSRRTNNYCRPWNGDLVKVVDAWKRKGGCSGEVECVCPECSEGCEGLEDKYRSLNLSHFLNNNGTFEIRLHQGCLDPEKIIKWATVCSNTFDFAKKTHLSRFNKLKNKDLSLYEKEF